MIDNGDGQGEQREIPSRGFAKLDAGIVDSTLWMKPHSHLRVWIALLAKCDSLGMVRASAPAMAHLCLMSLEEFQAIIADFCAPDEFSRSKEDDGRRLQEIEGGWMVVNYIRYRELTQRKALSHAERQSRYRQRVKARSRAMGQPEPQGEPQEPPQPKPEKKPKAAKYDPLDEPIPLLLSTPDFKAVWIEFVNWRRTAKKSPFLSSHGPQGAFRHLEPLGPERAVQALKIAMEKGWAGVEWGAAELLKREAGPTVSRGTSTGPGIVKADRRIEDSKQAIISNAYKAWSDRRITEEQRQAIVEAANAAKSLDDLLAIRWPKETERE